MVFVDIKKHKNIARYLIRTRQIIRWQVKAIIRRPQMT